MESNKLSQPTLNSYFGSVNPECWNDQYSDYLHRYARRKLNDEDLVKDIVQDTFLTAFEQVSKFGYRSTEKTWLIGILRIKILLAYRKRANERIFFSDELTLGISTDKHSKSEKLLNVHTAVFIDDPIDKKALAATVCRTISDFPFAWRAVFISRYVEERRSGEICKSLELTQTQYWMICHRLRVGLRASLLKAGFER
ncbi:sigma-70 family RNA polymerase sigma factor [Mucilaginibacter rubeus]|uniref:Sigma-70 family RNA polymerase sigma factor n=1 Tax=Mucilaginibacter rubeus TaxID=2027860 RepID=A0AAE6JK17_9SPHI|nr:MULTISPECIES: sigma-70 family RNA polymerase sigma factor [Mucilaginibacter]QEM07184.1 sigma-70 family RNA polymerase sigma factor [Mucilaginibacter rubeus]QEM19640.1 sigma-70 family RNA polymerase sigma factor [Mucilaginibacter gossypii]QTE43666.1 sigma-70 family RNA polymerase sigma factor [Mucilaginibacter rubeus]QTE50266.1 sigma-70 family RNA polymerase sigma factor [Mucilaginibacter rubeus]QTE55353.1 sigma-70 family RNA polymerase sigma factor [Mucilaginibacter rubeus]